MSVEGGRSSAVAEDRLDHCCDTPPAALLRAIVLPERRARERVAAEVTAPLKPSLLSRRDAGARVRLRTTLEAGADCVGEVRVDVGDGVELATDSSSGTLTSFKSRCVSFSSEETGMCDSGAGAVAAARLVCAIFGNRVGDLLLEARRPRPRPRPRRRAVPPRLDFRRRLLGFDDANDPRDAVRLLSVPSNKSMSCCAFFFKWLWLRLTLCAAFLDFVDFPLLSAVPVRGYNAREK